MLKQKVLDNSQPKDALHLSLASSQSDEAVGAIREREDREYTLILKSLGQTGITMAQAEAGYVQHGLEAMYVPKELRIHPARIQGYVERTQNRDMTVLKSHTMALEEERSRNETEGSGVTAVERVLISKFAGDKAGLNYDTGVLNSRSDEGNPLPPQLESVK